MATETPWTAFFTSAWRGTDPLSESIAYASRGTTVVQMNNAPANYEPATDRGGCGTRVLRVMWPDPVAKNGFSGRSVGVRQTENSRWEFVSSGGGPLPFEDMTHYAKRTIRDRVTDEMLVG